MLTLVVYRVGGGSRLSGLMLVAATAAIMFVGPTVIGYLRKLSSDF
jgi:SulP family sulfate permease